MLLIRRLLMCCAAVAAVGLSGCGSGTMDAKEGAARRILLVGTGADPRFMDLHLINSVSEHHLMMALFEGLVAEDPVKDAEAEPGVAERWVIPSSTSSSTDETALPSRAFIAD